MSETNILPVLVLMCQGAALVKAKTGNNLLENARDLPDIITSTGARNPETRAFERGALRKVVANCAPNLRKLDKRVRIDLPVPCVSPFHPQASHSLPLFPQKTSPLNPTPNPSPTETNRNSHPFAKLKTTPGESYPLVSARNLHMVNLGCSHAKLRQS